MNILYLNPIYMYCYYSLFHQPDKNLWGRLITFMLFPKRVDVTFSWCIKMNKNGMK